MNIENQVVINEELVIPGSELTFSFSTSGGPGGQHANKAETRVTLIFNVANSPALTENQRKLLLARLRNRIASDGTLKISTSTSRSQVANRQEAIARFQSLLARALRPRKRRRPTKPSRAAVERRLEAKRRHSQRKQERQKRWGDGS
jgi:ribosome-associated protein